MKLLLLPLMFLFSAPIYPFAPAEVADDFYGIDFKNRSYPYRFSWGKHKRVNISLKNGKYEYDFRGERGSFDLSNVYITDITNDTHPEAIVMIRHVACGVSCGGRSLPR
jgi:hypothetical protein